VFVYWLTGTIAFTPGGIEALATADPAPARAAFALLIAGFGVKAGLMPLHSWLPDAMVAPTPVSGLLHAVAVVKSGVFGVSRVVLEVYGPETVGSLGLGLPLAVVATVTLLAASAIALRKDHLKQRLAYSTVSQLSYIVLGLAVLSPNSITGGLLHIPAHAFMKLTLFLCAGVIHVETHTDHISEMAGIGKRMPTTMAAFGVAAAGMAGIPLVAGFVSKFYLLVGTVSTADEVSHYVFAVALLVSGVLNVAYFWPVVYQAFFQSAADHDAKPLVEFPVGGERRSATPRTDGGDPEDADANDPAVEDAETDSDDEADTADETVDHEAVDPEAIGRPDFSGESVERDYSDPAPPDASDSEDDALDRAAEDHHEPGDHGVDDEGHHGGPPAGGWERRDWLGEESTWFMLGPVLAAMAGSVVLGLVPAAAVFLRLVDAIVSAALTVGVVG
jgi:NADH:ubiquinone oxidoreductase subunit 5 (subunit L)/multisubunit Na+/H+ antiporter MnhA subunit